MTSCLLIVDVQNDFCEGGSLAVAGGADVATAISEHYMANNYDIVIASQDWHIEPHEHFASWTDNKPDYANTWPDHCVAETIGAELHPNLHLGLDAVFRKGMYSAAYSAFEGRLNGDGDLLGDWLSDREVTLLYVCGIATDFCVKATILDSVKRRIPTVFMPRLTVAVNGGYKDSIVAEIQQATNCLMYVGD